MKKKVSIATIAIIVIIVLICLGNLINFTVDIKWFSEVGYLSVFFTKIVATLKLMVPIFIISYIGIWFYYKSLKNSINSYGNLTYIKKGKDKSVNKIFILVDFIVSFFISYEFASTYWYRILQFNNSVSFNKKDPIFNMDASFYVFKLPLIESLYGVLMTILVLLVIITLVTYFALTLKGNLSFESFPHSVKGIKLQKNGLRQFAGKQLAVVSSLIIFLMAFGYVIKALNLVYSKRGVVFGAGYTDVTITLLFYKIIVVLCVISSVVIFLSIKAGKIKPIIISVCIVFGMIICNGIVSGVTQSMYVKPNEKNLEAKYIKNNMDATRFAFNIHNVEEKDFNVENNLTKEDLIQNKDTIDNIKVNSYAQALEFYNQTQVIKYYYKFNDLDVDRYNINGKGTQVFIAPREIDVDSLDQKSSNWTNKHLFYTHGYGVVMSKVKSVTSEGKPDFIIKDIPPENNTDLTITDPRIYFGEKTNNYAIVNNTLGEFDYPKGSGNVTNNYNGAAGIKMNAINKILFAIKEKDVSFLVSRNITKDSKILINRNIVERVEKIAPFLDYDDDPYVVLVEGKLYWVIDAYTTSNRYPYSQPTENGANYMRNSVKVVIDAVNGKTDFYIMDKEDPIAASYAKIFPELFKNMEALPSGIKEHLRYPEDLFKVQCSVMGKYHVNDPGVLYNGDDLWQIAQNQKQIGGEKTLNENSYVYMKLPEESKEEMVLMNYFNVRNKDNMISLFGARMDGENYGKLVLYRFPSQKTVYSPYLFKQSLNQDTTISSQLALWNKEGSQVIYGDTIVFPINNSLIYIEPIYLRASGASSIPEMKRVVVSYGDKIVLTESVDLALKQIFNIDTSEKAPVNTAPQTTVGTTTDSAKIIEAKKLYEEALAAQKAGDWTKYGESINKLGTLLEEISK